MAFRILCVDDHPLVLNTLRLILESEKYLVTTAETATAALAHVGEAFDAAILDYQLPGMNGAALAGTLKSFQPGLPIVLFSGYTDIANVDTHPFDALLAKGSSLQCLVDTVRDVICRSQSVATETVFDTVARLQGTQVQL